MKQYFLSIILVIIVTIFSGCEGTNVIKIAINTTPENLKEKLSELFLNDNFNIEQNETEKLSTNWKKATKEENNIPDYTIEVRLEAQILKIDSGSEILLTLQKRSNLDSKDPNMPTYRDIDIINNDYLYKRWNAILKKLKEEYKK